MIVSNAYGLYIYRFFVYIDTVYSIWHFVDTIKDLSSENHIAP